MDYIQTLIDHLRTLHIFWHVRIEITKTETLFQIGYTTDQSGIRYALGRDANSVEAAKKAWEKFVKENPDYE